MTDPLDLPSEWSPIVLERVWSLIRQRLERGGIRPWGRLTVSRLDLAERHCVGELLGRAVEADRISIDLEVLDRLMAERDGVGLVAAVEEVCGGPLVARDRRPASPVSRRTEPFADAEVWLAAHPEADWPWVGAWLEGLQGDGTLEVDPDPRALLHTALEVLLDRRAALAGAAAKPVPISVDGSSRLVGLTRLAERTAHDTHALDSDRLLSAVVLRGLAVRAGTGPLGGAAERRWLWETAGVVTDLVSSTCLTWGLIGQGLPWAARGAPRPVHLTLWDLEAGATVTAPGDILVCENPQVLEAVARAEIEIGAICTTDRPNLVVNEVLARARAGGARLRYHGDFDWPGIALANDVFARHGAVPWLMEAEAYLTAPGSLPLGESAVEPCWETGLGAAMRLRGVAVHEVAVLDHLLDELMML